MARLSPLRPRVLLLVLPALLALVAPAAGQETPAPQRPNLIMIVADDLGYADVGCQEQSKDVRTPHLDAMAAAGVRFTDAYVSGPVCSPTRAGLLTGRYQQRFGFEQNPLGPAEEQVFGLPLDEITLPQQLKAMGYVTGIVGKWHQGTRPEMHPQKRGFDEFYGFLGGAHRYINNAEPQEGSNAIQRNGQAVGEAEYLTDAFTREAVDFIDRHHAEPFFLYLPYNAPHTPMQAPEKYLSRFPEVKRPKRRNLLAMLAAVDDGVGRIMETLREHDLEENTLVVFFSDNGGPTRANASRNTPLRGTKGTTLEGGIRVPFMLQWKGRLPEGRVEDRVAIQLDLFPTFIAAAGGEVPEGRTIDGENLLPYLSGEDRGVIHEDLFWRFGPHRAVRSGDWKLHWVGDAEPALYDLSRDPGESEDMAAAHPEVVEAMLEKYRAWDAQLMAPRWPGRLEGGRRPATRRDE